MSFRRILAICLLPLIIPSPALAVDGISVTAHWTGENKNLYGGYGQIVRHDIVNSEVTGHTVLYDNSSRPARNPVISPDGSRVAFLRNDGTIGIVPIDGGSVTVLPNSQSHGEACLDWPHADWIYYTKGGFSQPDGSKTLHRVNANTHADEFVLTFKKDDGTTDSGIWRFHIANDLRHAAVRPDDTNPHPAGCITAFDMQSDDHLRSDRSLGAVNDWRCSTGMDPEGVYLAEGNQPHTGTTIRKWADLSSVKSMIWTSIVNWGPDTSDTGAEHNRNAWSTNSPKWLCIHIGWGTRGARGANQMLINWVDEERIVVTDNTDGSYAFDDAGDFWVGSQQQAQPPEITAQPQDLTVKEGQQATFSITAVGTAPLAFQWQRDGQNITGATEPACAFSASLSDNGAAFRCRVSNGQGSVTSDAAVLTVEQVTVPNQPPQVEAGPEQSTPVNTDVLLAGQVSDDGLPGGTLTITWSRQSGPGQVQFSSGVQAETYARFDAQGEYVLELLATDGELSASDTVLVNVTPGPSISILSPNAGETWTAGSVQLIRWEAFLVDDVRIDYSTDGGQNWTNVVGSVDTTSGSWGAYPWTVPDTPTDSALIEMREYSLITSARSGVFSIQAAPQGLALTAPVAGDVLHGNENTAIQWTADGIDAVSLSFSADDGATWEAIAQVASGQTGWGDFTWTVPNVATRSGRVRVASPDGASEAISGQLTVVPEAAQQSGVELTRLEFTGRLPFPHDKIQGAWLDGAPIQVQTDDTFLVQVDLPAGTTTMVLTLEATDGTETVRRLMRIDLE